ncbi:MAG: hypothetical protein MJZ30_13320 [Paludibacteraceae bacterium]|nr:hypothetical protein [Paludibacteraceae bacterium]
MKSFVTHTTAQPTVESLTDYYPFGMAMPGRSYNAYRYGFNSQENVPELGDGHTTALYWEYDGRLGRRWNVDPKFSCENSVYTTFSGTPIRFSDILGDTLTIKKDVETKQDIRSLVKCRNRKYLCFDENTGRVSVSPDVDINKRGKRDKGLLFISIISSDSKQYYQLV